MTTPRWSGQTGRMLMLYETTICDQCQKRYWPEDVTYYDESGETECSNCQRERAREFIPVGGWPTVRPVRGYELVPWSRFAVALLVVVGVLLVAAVVWRVLLVADVLGNDAQAQCVEDGYSVAYCVDAR